jgi:hypothetical protein
MRFGIIAFAKPCHNRSLHLGQKLNNAPGRKPIAITHALPPRKPNSHSNEAVDRGCQTDIIGLLPLMENLGDRSQGFQAMGAIVLGVAIRYRDLDIYGNDY